MKIEAIFFKLWGGNKYYTNEAIDIPDGLVYTNEGSERYIKVREYIHEHRDDFGYKGMIMVLPCSKEKEENIIGWPMMVSVETVTSEINMELPISQEAQEQFKDMFKHLHPTEI